MKKVSWSRVIDDCRGAMRGATGRTLHWMSDLLDNALSGRKRDENARRCQDENPDRCIEGCTSLIQSGQEPNNNLSIAFNNRGLALGLRGDFDQAIRDFDQALKLNPSYAEAFRNRGEAYRLKGLYDLAIQNFDQALRLDPIHARAFNGRGNVYESKGDIHRAIRDYGQAIRLNPNDDSALNNLAWLYATATDRTLRNPAKALEYALRAVAISGANNADDLDTLAEAYYVNGDYSNAILTEKRAVALQSDSTTREDFEKSLAKFEMSQKQLEQPQHSWMKLHGEVQFGLPQPQG